MTDVIMYTMTDPVVMAMVFRYLLVDVDMGSVVSVQIGLRLDFSFAAELPHHCHWIDIISG